MPTALGDIGLVTCTLQILASAQRPQVLLSVKEDVGFPEVRGPGIVMVRFGKGKVVLVGDTGTWGSGNLSRPWSENSKFLLQLFRHLKRDQGVVPPKYVAGQTHEYSYQFSQLHVLPVHHPFVALTQPGFRYYTPRPETRIPYSEGSGKLLLRCTQLKPAGLSFLAVDIDKFTRFDEPASDLQRQKIALHVSRQGSVARVDASGEIAQWISPDLGAMIGFIPNDGIRFGDRWQKTEQVRVIPIRGSDIPATRPMEMEMIYVRDESVGGRPCRLIRSQAELWLSDLGVSADVLVPVDAQRGWQSAPFELYPERGGKLLVSREQWLDRDTSLVVKAQTQSRIVAWVHRKGDPVASTSAERDYAMVSLMAHIVSFEKN